VGPDVNASDSLKWIVGDDVVNFIPKNT
jgi:hypothetical protein